MVLLGMQCWPNPLNSSELNSVDDYGELKSALLR